MLFSQRNMYTLLKDLVVFFVHFELWEGFQNECKYSQNEKKPQPHVFL